MIGSGKTGKHWEIALELVSNTHPIEVPWIRRVFGDWPAVGFSWDSSADGDRQLLKRIHELFPEAIIMDGSDLKTVVAADESFREKGIWSAPHPRFLKH